MNIEYWTDEGMGVFTCLDNSSLVPSGISVFHKQAN